MDNCFRENKNKDVFAFAHYLIEKNIFKKIKIGFLMKGHTHEDIDQYFSTISTTAKRADIINISDLISIIKGSNKKQNVVVKELDYLFDIKSWQAPHIEIIQGHSEPHLFKLEKVDGRTVFTYKDWSTSEEWKNVEYSKTATSLLKSMPTGNPKRLKPKIPEDAEIARLLQTSTKLYTAGRITSSQKQEWDANVNSLKQMDRRKKLFPLNGLKKYITQQAHDQTEQEQHNDAVLEKALKRDHIDSKVHFQWYTDTVKCVTVHIQFFFLKNKTRTPQQFVWKLCHNYNRITFIDK